MRNIGLMVGLVFISTSLCSAQNNDPEVFLAPKRVTNFTEQRLMLSIKWHRHGNLSDAAWIQRSLERYYADKGDTASAAVCETRARAAEAKMNPRSKEATQHASRRTNQPADHAMPVTPPQHSDWSGRYYVMEGDILHQWDFNNDGTFLHETVVSGNGTSIRNEERGTFTLAGNILELTIGGKISAYATPGIETHGRSTTQLGAGTQNAVEIRNMKIQFIGAKGEKGIVLDGKKLDVRPW